MFISVLELFKIGIGPSSSHTLGPMVAARQFVELLSQPKQQLLLVPGVVLRCTLKGSLAFTGKGHSTDRAVALGLHGFSPEQLATMNVGQLIDEFRRQILSKCSAYFSSTTFLFQIIVKYQDGIDDECGSQGIGLYNSQAP